MGKVRRPLALFSLSLAPVLGASPGAQASAPPAGTPLFFVENRGQCASEVRYLARAPGLTAALLGDGFALALGDEAPLRVRFLGAAPDARATGSEALATRVHYLVGERSDWRRDLVGYARVRLVGLYPGVDLELYHGAGGLEYDLVLAPGAALDELALVVEGARVAPEGEGLRLGAGAESVLQRAPVAWQIEADGTRTALPCSWLPRADGSFAFDLAGRDPGRPAVIDPVLVYSTYVGGSGADQARGVFVDPDGQVYVAGWARSFDFPGAPLEPGVRRGKEGVVFKLAAGGGELVYAAYFGGRGDDEACALRVDAQGQAHVTGTTQSADFPTTAHTFGRSHRGASDVFVLTLAADGASVLGSTLLGGTAEDEAVGLELLPDGSVVVAGTTRSRDFPSAFQALQPNARGGRDAFVARLDGELGALVCSTLLGGSDDDECRGLAVDASGNLYLAGRTLSHDFPTTEGAFDRHRCGPDAFVAKLGPEGGRLFYATFLGGSGADEAQAVAVDAEQRAVVVGVTRSSDFPFPPGAPAPALQDGFAVRLSTAGNALGYATRLGGASADEALGVCLDPFGAAFVVGRTRSADFPVRDGFGRARLEGAEDGFLVELSAEAGAPVRAGLLGGAGEDELCAVHLDAMGGGLAVAGWADGIALEQRGPLTGKRRGPADALVVRLDPRAPPPTPPALPTPRDAPPREGLLRAGF